MVIFSFVYMWSFMLLFIFLVFPYFSPSPLQSIAHHYCSCCRTLCVFYTSNKLSAIHFYLTAWNVIYFSHLFHFPLHFPALLLLTLFEFTLPEGRGGDGGVPVFCHVLFLGEILWPSFCSQWLSLSLWLKSFVLTKSDSRFSSSVQSLTLIRCFKGILA